MSLTKTTLYSSVRLLLFSSISELSGVDRVACRRAIADLDATGLEHFDYAAFVDVHGVALETARKASDAGATARARAVRVVEEATRGLRAFRTRTRGVA